MPERRRDGRWQSAVERGLLLVRGFVMVPVVVLVAAALTAFGYGAALFLNAVRVTIERPLPVGDKVGSLLVVTDLFLVGATLLIAAFGLYELFISPIDPAGTRALPAWLEMRDLNDLKARVIAMIVLVAAVTFAEVLVTEPAGGRVLELGAGVALVIAALSLYLRFGGQDHGRG